ncbi:MAG: protein kinase [Candidatus Wallbacteria bacterium]|nr:protein kinase [Candidatus Wallbacteria bacterium]
MPPALNQTASNPSLGRPCPQCSRRSPPGAQFCGVCGHRFDNLATTMTSGKRAEVAVPADPAALDTGPIGPLPAVLGAYRVESVIGSGGMGWVYKGVDISLARTVAIKTLMPDLAGTTEARLRFEREARTVAALEHPNITAIYYLDARATVPYYAMEFVEGESLDDRLRRVGRLAPIDVCRLMAQASGALAAAAAAGVVHRDIKPSNILLRARDGAVKLTDFGLAKPVADKSLTGAQVIVGTPLYMSPEQAMGKPLDYRSDLYSLGVTFYHALAGQPPFDDESAMAVMLKHLKDPLPPLAPLAPNAPASLVATIERMLAKEPAARHVSYDELISELAAAGGELSRSEARTSGRLAVAGSRASRQPVSGAAVAPPASAATESRSGDSRPAARAGEAALPATGAPAIALAAAPFGRRCASILIHPVDFFGANPAAQPGALRHWLGVAAIASFMSLRPFHGPNFVQAFVGIGLFTAVIGAGAAALMLLMGRGLALSAAARIVGYAATPLALGGTRLMPWNVLFMLVLVFLGARGYRRNE